MTMCVDVFLGWRNQLMEIDNSTAENANCGLQAAQREKYALRRSCKAQAEWKRF